MHRLVTTIVIGLLAVLTVAGPVAAKRDFGAIYVDDAIYRAFGNPANVPDGSGTDPFAIFTNSARDDQLGVAEFAPGSPTGHHGGRLGRLPCDVDRGGFVDVGHQLGSAPAVRGERAAEPHA